MVFNHWNRKVTNTEIGTRSTGYISRAVIKHHNQENLEKKKFIWAYGSRGLVSMMVEQRHSSRSRKRRAFILNHKPIAEKSKFQTVWVFKLSNPDPSDVSSSTRTYVLNSMYHPLDAPSIQMAEPFGLLIQNTMPPVTVLLPMSSRLSTCTSVSGFYVGAEDLNLDPHTCSSNTLPHVAIFPMPIVFNFPCSSTLLYIQLTFYFQKLDIIFHVLHNYVSH